MKTNGLTIEPTEREKNIRKYQDNLKAAEKKVKKHQEKQQRRLGKAKYNTEMAEYHEREAKSFDFLINHYKKQLRKLEKEQQQIEDSLF